MIHNFFVAEHKRKISQAGKEAARRLKQIWTRKAPELGTKLDAAIV